MNHFLSFWERDFLLKKFDFAVLGAGLIGKQIAIKLKMKFPDARVAIIDRSPISYGASTRNAGFACFGSVSEIVDDFSKSPVDEVIKLAEKRFIGINSLVNTFGADSIGYRPTGSYEIYTEQNEYNIAQENYQEINRLLKSIAGIDNAFSWRKTDDLKMNCFDQCLFNPYEGMLNTGLLNETINDAMHRAGVIPLYGIDVKQINPYDKGYTLSDEQGMEINCSQLIVATNAFASLLMPELDIVPARGQIVITKPLNNLPFDGIFHNDKGYIYFRNFKDRLLLGGARNHFESAEQTYDFNGSEEVYGHLVKYIREVILPGRDFEIDMHWSGIMAMGHEKLPIVKRVDDHLILCVRMSGMGVALGPVLSDEVVSLMD